jgi:''Cold-shock'' DNA-binding domain.
MTIEEGVRLAKLQQYDEALAILDERYAIEEERFGVWDLYFYGKCLRKAKDYTRAVKLNRLVYIRMPEHEQNRNAYAWNLYDLYVKPSDKRHIDESKMLSTASFIIKITEQGTYSPYERTVFTVLKHLKSKDKPHWEALLDWHSKLNPDLLDREVRTVTDEDGVERELASYLEEWHYYHIICLFGLGDWEACIKAADEALGAIRLFHYNYDMWIRIKKALSVYKLGNPASAALQLEQIGIESGLWQSYYELFKLYQLIGDREKALTSAAVALLSRNGETKHKMKLLLEFGAMLEQMSQKQEALKHYSLVCDIRKQNGWPPNERLNNHIAALEGETGLLNAGNPRELERYWNTLRLNKQDKRTGTVQKLVSEGKSGFIVVDESEDTVYFRARDVKGKGSKIPVGQRVSFYMTDAYDRKKQRLTKQAIEIRLI